MIGWELFGTGPAKIYKPSFIFLDSISSFQNSSLFITFFLRYSWFKNPAILLAESMLAYNPRTINFPDSELVQAQS